MLRKKNETFIITAKDVRLLSEDAKMLCQLAALNGQSIAETFHDGFSEVIREALRRQAGKIHKELDTLRRQAGKIHKELDTRTV